MRLLVMVRHFAPSSRAVGVTTRQACLALPPGTCEVLTADRTFDPDGLFDPDFGPGLPVHRVSARLAGRFPRHPLPHNLDYLSAVVCSALRLLRTGRFDAIVAHYPDRFTLMAGLAVHVLTRRPLVLHMHDYLSEALPRIHPLRAAWWRAMERLAFSQTALLVVPTPRFAQAYRRRGYRRVFVLPHLAAPRKRQIPHTCSAVSRAAGEGGYTTPDDDGAAKPLDIVYTGNIYEAHLDATRAFVDAVRGMSGVRLRFATPSRCDFLEGVSVGAVSRRRCLQMQEEADALFLPLGISSIYPLEVQSCLPSKLLDYLAAGKPVLAVVPEGSYVAELVEREGFGVTVTTTDAGAIRRAVERLRRPSVRARYAAAALEACQRFAPGTHGPRFEAALARACGVKGRER